MVWFPKDDQGLKTAYTEIQRHKAGHKARIGGTAAARRGSMTIWSLSHDQ
jgi:hypothetical protein